MNSIPLLSLCIPLIPTFQPSMGFFHILTRNNRSESEIDERDQSAMSTAMHNARATTIFLHDICLRLMKVFCVVLVALPFAGCWFLYYTKSIVAFTSPLRSIAVLSLFIILYCYFARVYEAFLLSQKRISELCVSQVLGILMADCFMFIVLWLMSRSFPNILPALAALVGQIVLSSAWCVFGSRWYAKRYSGKKTAVIYDRQRDIGGLFSQYSLSWKFDIQLSCVVQDCLKNLESLHDMDVVFLCGIHSHDRNTILKYCIANSIQVYVIPKIGDVIMSGAKPVHLFHLPMLRVGRYNPSPEYRFIKRLFDVVSSLTVIIATSPVLLITAIAVKAQDGGPVFYRQTRLTKDGRLFKILKFRSMRMDAEKDGVARLSSGENDDRITKVGHFIRRCRIDELPQLFNILGGSMSVVGPRPERPEIADEYAREMPEFNLRLQAKAGLTGYAQVYGKYNTTPYDKLQMDLMYISSPSLIEDLKIIFATVRVLFMKESTEGISAGAVNAMEEGKGSGETTAS